MDILSLLNIHPSPQSLDFVSRKAQFQLHSLVTEQRHPLTWNLSFAVKEDTARGLAQIFSVDDDVSAKFRDLARDSGLLDQAAEAVTHAILDHRKIFIYGCGATGRLAKQMESALWRPFWRKMKQEPWWPELSPHLPQDIEDLLIGEMTGGDRALISSLEGFEDLPLMGRLQLADREIRKGDVVFAVTEGGETSSVIGAVVAAAEAYGRLDKEKIADAARHLYFIYNNPDELLAAYTRSRQVLDNPAITKLNLTTGPQAVAGSTRMQAATSETFVMGAVLEAGIAGALAHYLDPASLSDLGFPQDRGIGKRLLTFDTLKAKILPALPEIAAFTEAESDTYKAGRFAAYFSHSALIAVFIDCTERSPTFRLSPLDTVSSPTRKCWLQVLTAGKDGSEAWRGFLGRSFRGLDEAFYRPRFESGIKDVYLRESALNSLSQAGKEQEGLYDFSLSEENLERRGPEAGDLGVVVCVDEELEDLRDPASSVSRFISAVKAKNARLALILLSDQSPEAIDRILSESPGGLDDDIVINLSLDTGRDPLSLDRQMLLKVLLNAHSSAAMARLGRVVGNTMTHVHPSNLKLIGRATHLIQSHVNDAVTAPEWDKRYGKTAPISYAEANAVLFAAMEFRDEGAESFSEVELATIRILEALRRRRFVAWEEAQEIAVFPGFESYLERHNERLRAGRPPGRPGQVDKD